MTSAQRLLSLSLMSGLTLAVAPLAGAQGPLLGLDTNVQAEIRVELEACHDNNEEHDDRKTCAAAAFSEYGIEKPEGHGRRGRRGQKQDIPEDVRAELKACHENNIDDRAAVKVCAQAIFDANGIEKPEHRGRGQKIGHMFRSSIVETCGEREDSDEWRTCAKDTRGEIRGELQEERPRAFNRFQNRRSRGGIRASTDLRAALRACLDLEDNEEVRECVFGVRASARAQVQN